MATSSNISTLEQLTKVFPDVILIDSRQLAKALGIAAKTVHNAGENFPIPCIRFGRKKFYRIVDVASYLDRMLGIDSAVAAVAIVVPASTAAPAATTNQKRGRGRPPNVVTAARATHVAKRAADRAVLS